MYVLHMYTSNTYMLIGPDLPRQHTHIHIDSALQEGPLQEGPTCTHSTAPSGHPRAAQANVRYARAPVPTSSKRQSVSTTLTLTTQPPRRCLRELEEEHQQSIRGAGMEV